MPDLVPGRSTKKAAADWAATALGGVLSSQNPLAALAYLALNLPEGPQGEQTAMHKVKEGLQDLPLGLGELVAMVPMSGGAGRAMIPTRANLGEFNRRMREAYHEPYGVAEQFMGDPNPGGSFSPSENQRLAWAFFKTRHPRLAKAPSRVVPVRDDIYNKTLGSYDPPSNSVDFNDPYQNPRKLHSLLQTLNHEITHAMDHTRPRSFEVKNNIENYKEAGAPLPDAYNEYYNQPLEVRARQGGATGLNELLRYLLEADELRPSYLADVVKK